MDTYRQILLPALRKDSTITGGNSLSVNDEAAALVLMSDIHAEKQGMKVLATIIAYAKAAVESEKVNINGIAAGHPISASGARIILTPVYKLKRRSGGIGIAAICSRIGQGDAIISEVAG